MSHLCRTVRTFQPPLGLGPVTVEGAPPYGLVKRGLPCKLQEASARGSWCHFCEMRIIDYRWINAEPCW
jgi:hypothetical protein